MNTFENLKFQTFAPKLATDPERIDIYVERMKYYQRTLPVNAGVNVKSFMESMGRKSWDNPNLSARRSRRSKPLVTLAKDKSIMQRTNGFIYTANDASSNKPGVLGKIEEQAKLHIPVQPFIGSRWLWVRELIYPEDRPELGDVLGAIATHPSIVSSSEQPMSCYPYAGEDALVEKLSSWGFVEGETEIVKPQGFVTGIEMTRWTADAVGNVHERLMAIDGIADVVDRFVAK